MAESLTSLRLPLGIRILRYWLPVFLMLGLMYYFSTDVFSGENTRSILQTVLDWIAPNTSGRALAKIHLIVRKSAHFFEFAALAVLVFRAFRAESSARWRLSWAVYSMTFVISWALLDELHQAFTRRRGASIYDSLLDSCGGLVALILIGLLSRGWRRRRD